jgi:hypothetical protein
MSRSELKEIVERIIKRVEEEARKSPQPACIFYDNTCDVTTMYAVNEEA